MTTNGSFDRRLAGWLREEGEHRVPDHLDEVLVRTVATRQRAWWSSPERWLPMDTTRRISAPLAMPVARIVLVGLLILALVAAIAVVGSQRPPVPAPFGVAANGIVTIEDGGDVFVADPDGRNQRPVLAGDTNDFGVSFSRDGTQMFFVRAVPGEGESTLLIPSQLFVADPDGTDARPLTEPLTELDWYEPSPTGDRIVFVHTVDGRRVLSITEIDAPASLRRLPVPDDLQVDAGVLWRPPLGEEILFTARPTRNGGRDVGLYRIRPDGSGFAAVAPTAAVEWGYNGLELSPDGGQLAYWQYDRDASSDGFGASVHIVDLGTGEDRIVRFVDDLKDEAELRFSPDGSQAVIVRCPDQCRLHVVALDGSRDPLAVGPAIPGDQSGRQHGFSPDGTTIRLHVNGERPIDIDPTTGLETPWERPVQALGGWQRLAP